MSQENLQTMIMQNFWGVKEVYYGIVQVVNCVKQLRSFSWVTLVNLFGTKIFALDLPTDKAP